MASIPRYAIYYAPSADAALARFGATLIGYDVATGAESPFPAAVGTIPDWKEITAEARKYGFHATLKAPFSLREGRTEDELQSACASFAAEPRAIPLITPVVDAISGFIAVMPGQPSASLQELAADCVRGFDAFRAPLSPEDRARRKPEQLSERQVSYLDRFGYPYVMEQYRFHMTLTCRLDDDRRGAILTLLRAQFAELKLQHLAIDRIALFKQPDTASRFRIIGSWPLVPQP